MRDTIHLHVHPHTFTHFIHISSEWPENTTSTHPVHSSMYAYKSVRVLGNNLTAYGLPGASFNTRKICWCSSQVRQPYLMILKLHSNLLAIPDILRCTEVTMSNSTPTSIPVAALRKGEGLKEIFTLCTYPLRTPQVSLWHKVVHLTLGIQT